MQSVPKIFVKCLTQFGEGNCRLFIVGYSLLFESNTQSIWKNKGTRNEIFLNQLHKLPVKIRTRYFQQ